MTTNNISTASPSLRFAGFFSDHMVLQRQAPIPVWGWAPRGAEVSVQLGENKTTAKPDESGKWMAKLPAVPAGGPFTLTASDGTKSVQCQDVLIGDVWLCSGQSNMGWSVANMTNSAQIMSQARHSMIRHVNIPKLASINPQQDVSAMWVVCSPSVVGDWTAVGYAFGEYLYQKLGIPIGLLHASWGGSNCQTWCSRAALEAEPELRYLLEMLGEDAVQKGKEDIQRQIEAFNERCTYKDPGNVGFGKGWANPSFDVSDWKTMDIPRNWESVPGMNIDGSVWFRKQVMIPPTWAGKELTLRLGACDDFDVTYFNGKQIGATGMETTGWWMAQREYVVPATMVTAGTATIAVRVFDRVGSGGMIGGGPMTLAPSNDPGEAIRLEGDWLYKVELALDPKPFDGWPATQGLPGEFNSPCALSNAMIEPLIPFGITGAIWYQGESNAGRAWEYRTLFPALIRDWRKRWGRDFPFLFVQLANFMPSDRFPHDSSWAELREAQAMALAEPETAMAVTVDVGDGMDIHPRNKKDVGVRLALAAQKTVYGADVIHSGPIYKSMAIKDNAIHISFDHLGSGLMSLGGVPAGFSIAGADRKFVWAYARIDGDHVVVWSDQVKNPQAVRYAWANNPFCNLYNIDGLPASPFRTDDWPAVTAPK